MKFGHEWKGGSDDCPFFKPGGFSASRPVHFPGFVIPSKIEWVLTNGVAIELSNTQVQWVLLISWNTISKNHNFRDFTNSHLDMLENDLSSTRCFRFIIRGANGLRAGEEEIRCIFEPF